MDAQWLAQLPIDPVIAWHNVLGGDINEAYHLQTEDDDYFLLVQPHQTVAFYQHEIDGLTLIGQIVSTPKVIAAGEIEGAAYLLTTYIGSGSGDQYILGQMVAQLHHEYSPNQQFGYDTAFKTGPFTVQNGWSTNWTEFFLSTRLRPLATQLKRQHLFLESWAAPFDRGMQTFKALMADYDPRPSLLHGDLWAGNYMFGKDGTPYLIDPSVWYGDREYDIALTTVFGGYNERFYKGYNDAFPLAPHADARMQFYRLYYLMIHLMLFGETYQPTITGILDQY